MNPAQKTLYPLQGALPLLGLFFGALTMTAFQSVAIGFATLVVFSAAGMTWRRDMPPILPFCLFLQWISAVAGTMFFRAYGYFPGGGDTAGLELMIWMSSLGFLALGVGARAGFNAFAKSFKKLLAQPAPRLDPKRLFMLILGLYLISIVFDIAPTAIWFGGAQIIYSLLDFRFVFLVMLGLIAIADKSAKPYLWAAVLVVVAVQMLTGFSRFKEVFFVILLIALFQWRPWERSKYQKSLNAKIVMMGVPGAAFILGCGLLWTGGLKKAWRAVVWGSGASQSPTENLAQLSSVLGATVENFDLGHAVDQLVQRVASGSMYFSYVLRNVPEITPFENGALLYRAVVNATVPRFLFPEKLNLGGDSWLVRRYAGLRVSGDESGTSVGLGYMAEFFIDFGITGLLIFSFAYAFILLVLMRILVASSKDKFIFIGMSYSLLSAYFMTFDASIAKILAGAIQRTIIFAVLAAIVYPTVYAWLTKTKKRLHDPDLIVRPQQNWPNQ
jgi:hypothetical protein